jgi:hypothetical protein
MQHVTRFQASNEPRRSVNGFSDSTISTIGFYANRFIHEPIDAFQPCKTNISFYFYLPTAVPMLVFVKASQTIKC